MSNQWTRLNELLAAAVVKVEARRRLGQDGKGTGCFVAMGYAVASIIPTSESAPAITNAAYLGLVLLTVLLRYGGLPADVRHIGEHIGPLSNLTVPIEHAWLGTWTGEDWLSALVLAAWGTAAVLWSVRRFRWEPAGER